MSERKISECISVRINVGNYQHIELTKYAEEKISYNSDEDRINQEDNLRDDLVASLVRSMKSIPEKLGKGAENAVEVEEAIKKAIPDWLENGPVPNIANNAEKKHIQNTAEQKAHKEDLEDNLSEVLNEKIEKPSEKEKPPEKKKAEVKAQDDLFNDEDDDLF